MWKMLQLSKCSNFIARSFSVTCLVLRVYCVKKCIYFKSVTYFRMLQLTLCVNLIYSSTISQPNTNPIRLYSAIGPQNPYL